MKKILILILMVLLSKASSFGQMQELEGRAYPRVDTYPIGGSLKIENDYPLILIGTLETNAPSLIMDSKNLLIVRRFQDPSEIKFFGDKGVNGVLVAELKEKVPLLRLEEVLDYFEVPQNVRYLKVLVDKNLINPELFLADVKKIKKIEVLEVTEQEVLLNLFYNHWAKVKGEKYLNIITAEE
ncbi:hypothetical protein AHMF7605_12080 [Adhaeribacter arboris]|uniref:DUF4369 domain-containing protein n=1 Tax=Adhaeribacter arboris TaxID=2072846 RepID=A0A2T2YFC3_9BACT|nr:hypothetical protein [Adhaeribacter arboris]PSR54207.1 hypothetical protein AHMF7605_12080 [Adhaeribacter arboris]